MPYYVDIKKDTEEGRRTIERLVDLREKLKKDIPNRTMKDTLLLATWNIREFDSSKFGDRMDEAMYYIAEIIDRFDIIAIQEVNKDLKALERLKRILGSNWDYIFSDTSPGTKGNDERLAILFDKRKVTFGGLAGELTLPDVKVGKEYVPVSQFARTPFMCGFRSGWTKFILSTVHIIYGTGTAEPPERVREIEQVAKELKKMMDDKDAWARNLILLGDFNIFRPENKTFGALTGSGFVIPDKIQQLPSNYGEDKHYDQIAFMDRRHSLEWTGRAGVFKFYTRVFRATMEDEEIYKKYVPNYEKDKEGKVRNAKERTNQYRTWCTYQMSDHLPMWVELRIDYSDEYLKAKIA